jgi:hypothetical protein
MGFEPFIPPKRPAPTPDKLSVDAPRDERVMALARMLHQRGITSSMADAKRLAEGMVDVEKRVVKQERTAPPAQLKAEIPGIEAAVLPKHSFGLSLPEDFTQFVAKAAALSHEAQSPVPPIESPVEKSVVYGREEQHVIASVPHFHARNQQMFDDAPDVTQLRGYKEESKTASPIQSRVENIQTPATPRDEVVRVESSEDAVKIVRSETTPNVEIIEEQMIVAEPLTPAETDNGPAVKGPSAAELLAEELKDAPEETVELPKSEKKQYTDPGKEHGVDIFDIFKRKG